MLNVSRYLFTVTCAFIFGCWVPLSQASDAGASNAEALTLYVSPSGDDANPGSQDKPFATLTRARDDVRKRIQGGLTSDVIVYFREGVYPMYEPVVLGLQDGSDNHSITYAAYPGEFPVLSSGLPIRGWTKLAEYPSALPEVARGRVWVADLPDRLGNIKALFDGESILPRARSEGFNCRTDNLTEITTENREEERYKIYFPEGKIKNWANLEDVEVLAYPNVCWVMNILPLAAVDEVNRIARFTIPATYPVRYLAGNLSKSIPKAVFVENVIDFLDEPGEWVVNTQERKIYYWPKSEVPSDHIVAPVLQEMIKVEGRIDIDGPTDIPVKNVHFKGLTFMHGERDTWKLGDIGLQHDWEMYDKATALVRFRGAENCSVEACRFAYSGGTGLRMDLYGQNITVEKCLFEELGAMGVLICGYGPGTKDVSKNNTVINNLFTQTGRLYWHGHAFCGFQTGNSLVAHNTFFNLPRKAIGFTGVRSVGFDPEKFKAGWKLPERSPAQCIRTNEIRWDELEGKENPEKYELLLPYYHTRNNIAEYNWCDNVLYTGADGAAINCTAAGHGIEFRYNLVCNAQNTHIRGIRLDDVVRGAKIYKNILYNGRLFELKDANNETYNNIFVFNKELTDLEKIPRCVRIEGDKVGKLVRNVFYYEHDFTCPDVQLRGKSKSLMDIDYNLYYDATNPDRAKSLWEDFRSKGYDQHGVFADPLFVDVKKMDFRLQPDSPLKKLGFEEFTIDGIGITSEFPAQWNRYK